MTRKPPTHVDRETAIAARTRVEEGTDPGTVRAAFGFSRGTWHRILSGAHVSLAGLGLSDLHQAHRPARVLVSIPALAPLRQTSLPLTGHAGLDAARAVAWWLPVDVRKETGADGEVRAHALDLLEHVAGYTAAGARRTWADCGHRARAAHPPMLSLAEWWRLRGALPASRGGEERDAQAEIAADAVGGSLPSAASASTPALVPVPTGDPVEMALQAALEIRREQRALAARVEAVDDKASRALELADRASRAGVQARVSRDRIQAAVGHLSRRVQQHCAAHGLDFATVFREGRRDIGLRPTKEGGPSLGKANLRPDQVLRLARFYAAQGVAGCSPRIVEEIMHGGGDDAALEVTA